ncbi:hypothetical protein ACIQLJ_02065 [Microbacterium sp. NPDC091313]
MRVDATGDHELTLWLSGDVPARMFYAGRRWTVTDMPTRLPAIAASAPASLDGWRFQATDAFGESVVFDVCRGDGHWHVHRAYA